MNIHRHVLTRLDRTLKLKQACFWKIVETTFPNQKEVKGRESSKACQNMKQERLHTLPSSGLYKEHEQQQLY